VSRPGQHLPVAETRRSGLIREGFEVVVISARQVKSLRIRYGTAGNKDDRFDAFVLAEPCAPMLAGGPWSGPTLRRRPRCGCWSAPASRVEQRMVGGRGARCWGIENT
jgi:hypothetical protein